MDVPMNPEGRPQFADEALEVTCEEAGQRMTLLLGAQRAIRGRHMRHDDGLTLRSMESGDFPFEPGDRFAMHFDEVAWIRDDGFA